MGIEFYDYDFCKSDLDEVTNPDELETMQADLQDEIWNCEEQIETCKRNMGIVQSRINEVENDNGGFACGDGGIQRI